MAQSTQTFENHAKFVPAYHFFTFALIFVNFFYWLYHAAVGFSLDTAVGLVAAVALLLVGFFARAFALAVQDRVIRLEMRLRLNQVAPDLSARFDELTANQFCALRFASDAELPELTRKVLADKVDNRTAIKKMVRDWQPDLFRA